MFAVFACCFDLILAERYNDIFKGLQAQAFLSHALDHYNIELGFEHLHDSAVMILRYQFHTPYGPFVFLKCTSLCF